MWIDYSFKVVGFSTLPHSKLSFFFSLSLVKCCVLCQWNKECKDFASLVLDFLSPILSFCANCQDQDEKVGILRWSIDERSRWRLNHMEDEGLCGGKKWACSKGAFMPCIGLLVNHKKNKIWKKKKKSLLELCDKLKNEWVMLSHACEKIYTDSLSDTHTNMVCTHVYTHTWARAHTHTHRFMYHSHLLGFYFHFNHIRFRKLTMSTF